MRAIGVILSGTGSDGSRGLADIHAAGGIVLAQNPETAKFDGMPRNALETGLVDLKLSPDEMPEFLVRYINRVDGMALEQVVGEPGIGKNDLERIFDLLQHEFGIDFSLYKPGTVARRIERRIDIAKIGSLEEYTRALRNSPAELNQLYFDLLIGVTRFFRDAQAFATLEHEVLPRLVDRLGPDEEFRGWVAGCATGEEAYSLAILIHEQLTARGRPLMYKIFATDVHPGSLEVASAGIYDQASLAGLSQERLERFFTPRGKRYQISQDVRSRIVFSRHNVIKDAPFTRLDLISCRNLLIYFQSFAQRKAVSLFHFGLKVGGVLNLGPSESVGEFAEEFDVLDPHWKIFGKRRGVRLRPETQPTNLSRELAAAWHTSERAVARGTARTVPLMGIYDALLNTFVPPALLVNERREVIHSFAGAGRYLVQYDGRFSPDVLDMVDERLRVALAAALHRVGKTGETASYSEIPVGPEGSGRYLELTAKPLVDERAHITYRLITFREYDRALAKGELSAEDPGDLAVRADIPDLSHQRLRELEIELQYTKENLQATIEELETSNEELQATNEELIASNEELQSTNEELHSVNEELYTVNAEHQGKIEELTELTNDLDNLFVSSDIGMIFLDRDLCIRKFTPRIADQFALIPQDIGRRIDCFSHNLTDMTLVEIIEGVIKTGHPYEGEVKDLRGAWLMSRVLPYSSDGRIEGAILAIIDISRLKQIQEELTLQAAKLEKANRVLTETIIARERAETEAREAVRRRDRFLAMLSHELRNPLSAITLSAELLDPSSNESAELTDAWRIIQRQARHLARLLDDLLDISRLDHDMVTLHTEPADLARIAEEAAESMKALAAQKQIVLSVDIEVRPQWVEGDPVRLQQILVNLLNNGIRYTPPGGIVHIAVQDSPDTVIVRVRDTGKGIPAEIIDKIFELFFQDDSYRDPSESSMGIGLSLVKRLVDLHRGTVFARSGGPGHGSEFEVRLPKRLPFTSPASPQAGEEPRPDSRESKQVVIVEDNADTRRMLQIILKRAGYEVITAADGEEGLELIWSLRPALALVDIGLPRIDGCEVARRIRADERGNETLLVALTGYGLNSDHDLIMAAGFDEHLVKPVRSDELTAFLASRLRVS